MQNNVNNMSEKCQPYLQVDELSPAAAAVARKYTSLAATGGGLYALMAPPHVARLIPAGAASAAAEERAAAAREGRRPWPCPRLAGLALFTTLFCRQDTGILQTEHR
jgi:hypothetical protein